MSELETDVAERRHQEMLRMQCLKIAAKMLVGDVEQEKTGEPVRLSSLARSLYHEATGRRWPEWDEEEMRR